MLQTESVIYDDRIHEEMRNKEIEDDGTDLSSHSSMARRDS